MTGLFDDDHGAGAGIGSGLMGGGLPAVIQQAAVVVKAPVGTTLDTIPDPHPPLSDGPLSPEEEQELAACRAGVNHLQDAFWVAGKSLETMARANLARESGYATYEEFLWETFEISKSTAYRLMQEWRVGEQLAAMGWRPRESHVRELTDIIKVAGDETAVAVYDTVARESGKVTADLLKQVVRKLPPLTAGQPPAKVQKVVQQAIRPQRQLPEQRPSTDDAAAAEPVPADPGEEETNEARADQRAPEPSGGQEQAREVPARLPEVATLLDVLGELKETSRRLSKAGVRRALEAAPEEAEPLVDAIKDQLNKLERVVAVRPSASRS
jgi:hypothetical protein